MPSSWTRTSHSAPSRAVQYAGGWVGSVARILGAAADEVRAPEIADVLGETGVPCEVAGSIQILPPLPAITASS